MKVLQVNVVYKQGSTGKIVYDIHNELQKNGVESIVCYGRGEKTKDAHVHKVCGELYAKLNNLLTRFTGIMYGGCLFSTHKLIHIIKREKPDAVHLHCLNGYFVDIYRLVSWLNKNKVKTVLTLHAEFMHTANCGHAYDCEKWKTGCGKCPRLKQETNSFFFDRTHRSWVKMKKAFDGFSTLQVVSVSPWLMERAKQSPILSEHRHAVVLNGLDTDVFHPYDTSALREELGITNEKVVFHATPYFSADINHLKGGYYILQLAEALKDSDVRVIVAGDYAERISIPENLTLLGRVSDQKKLAELYSLADVTVLASKRETFSMICAESLCCGTPVVGFEAGGPEQVALNEYSLWGKWGDVALLKNAIVKMLEATNDAKSIRTQAINRYAISLMADEYMKLYKTM